MSNLNLSTETPAQKGGSAVAAVVIVVVLAVAALMVAPQRAGGPAAATAQPSAASVGTGQVSAVTVEVVGMSFSPSTINVPVGNTLEVTLVNSGDQRHDLIFANGTGTDPLAPGDSATIDVGVISGNSQGWCSLPGHRHMGMILDIVATGASGGTGAPAVTGDGGDSHGGHASSSGPSMDELIQQAAAERPHPAELPSLTDTTDHKYAFTVTEDEQALSEGIVRPVWLYNGTSPGPTLHGRIGDTFTITVVNEGTMGHSVDFHAGDIAPDQPMRTIEPGESLQYVFTAKRSGIWMYHCSTMPMSLHIANGMFGAVVIEPDQLPAVDRSYVLIQSELYLGQDSATKVGALTPDLLAFNGRPFQYDAHPLPAQVGERVRMWVLDVGPNSALAFHIVGTQFDTVWSEGTYSVHHGQSTDGITQGETGAQVLALLAAEGGFVEFQPIEPGHYTFVNHIMSLAEKGAHGTLVVTE